METDKTLIAQRVLSTECEHCGAPSSKILTDHHKLCPLLLQTRIDLLEDLTENLFNVIEDMQNVNRQLIDQIRSLNCQQPSFLDYNIKTNLSNLRKHV